VPAFKQREAVTKAFFSGRDHLSGSIHVHHGHPNDRSDAHLISDQEGSLTGVFVWSGIDHGTGRPHAKQSVIEVSGQSFGIEIVLASDLFREDALLKPGKQSRFIQSSYPVLAQMDVYVNEAGTENFRPSIFIVKMLRGRKRFDSLNGITVKANHRVFDKLGL